MLRTEQIGTERVGMHFCYVSRETSFGLQTYCSKTAVVPCSERSILDQNRSTRFPCNQLKNRIEWRIFLMDQNPLVYLKTTVRETVPGVRIPLPPPCSLDCRESCCMFSPESRKIPAVSRFFIFKTDQRNLPSQR
jgi:hypothetical protein